MDEIIRERNIGIRKRVLRRGKKEKTRTKIMSLSGSSGQRFLDI